MSKQTSVSKSATPNFNKRLRKKDMPALLQIQSLGGSSPFQPFSHLPIFYKQTEDANVHTIHAQESKRSKSDVHTVVNRNPDLSPRENVKN